MTFYLKIKNSFILVLLTCVLSILLLGTTHAAPITVSPGFLRLIVSGNSPKATATYTISNSTQLALSFEARVVDVDVVTGTLQPLANTTVSQKTTSLLRLDKQSFTVAPGSVFTGTVEAINSSSLAPGGHYAAIEVKQIQNDSAQLPLRQAVSIGVFVTKEDGVVRTLTPQQQLPKGIVFRFPKQLDLTLRNDGNVDVVPRGYVTLTRAGSLQSKVMYNENSRPIFAGQSMTYSIDLVKNTPFLPGRYVLTMSYRADGGDQRFETSTIWYVPIWTAAATLGIVTALFLMVRRKRKYKITNTLTVNENGMEHATKEYADDDLQIPEADMERKSIEAEKAVTISARRKAAVKTAAAKPRTKAKTKKKSRSKGTTTK